APAHAAGGTVPGSSNPWLAGMPDGTGALFGDLAPAQSPVQVAGLPIVPGGVLSFTATGAVAQDPDPIVRHQQPDGGSVTHHNALAEHSISDTRAPWNSLL